MNTKFKESWIRNVEWLVWLGMPMIYDGGLCVNRTQEEHSESNRHTVSLIV